ncbi:hypothetical protein [Ferrimonas marina]|uniref:hypothetical protein n=1 Tax=Ferrimonas marina TaxID=299255 RepID=UPI00116109BC|nr:hypothetical protein [Ferrimonas marina]
MERTLLNVQHWLKESGITDQLVWHPDHGEALAKALGKQISSARIWDSGVNVVFGSAGQRYTQNFYCSFAMQLVQELPELSYGQWRDSMSLVCLNQPGMTERIWDHLEEFCANRPEQSAGRFKNKARDRAQSTVSIGALWQHFASADAGVDPSDLLPPNALNRLHNLRAVGCGVLLLLCLLLGSVVGAMSWLFWGVMAPAALALYLTTARIQWITAEEALAQFSPELRHSADLSDLLHCLAQYQGGISPAQLRAVNTMPVHRLRPLATFVRRQVTVQSS